MNKGPRPFDGAQGRERVERVLGFKGSRVDCFVF
jgi:hypothetical protein